MALLPIAVLLMTCGGPLIAVDLVIAPGQKPFDGVRTVRLGASGPGMETVTASVAYEPGAAVELPSIPPGESRVVTVEGLDAEGAVISRGESAPFAVTDAGPERVSVPFAACTTVLYIDADGDGHGDPQRSKRACATTGWVAAGDDCNDQNSDVHPGQTRYFSTGQSPPGNTKPFDYDCDGVETTKLAGQQVACAKSPPDCTGAGWRGSIPSCGGTGTYVECGSYPSCGEGASTTAQQTCR